MKMMEEWKKLETSSRVCMDQSWEAIPSLPNLEQTLAGTK